MVLNARLEEKAMRNGMESWFDCLNLSVPPSAHMPNYHYHDYIELLYALKTNAVVYLNGETYPFCDGDLIIINSNEPHDVSCLARSEYICVKFMPNVLYAGEQALFEYKYALPFLADDAHQKRFPCAEISHTEIGRLCAEISREQKQHGYAYELVIRADILKIFSWILRHWSEQGSLTFGTNIPDPIKKAILYMTAHYDTVTEAEVAAEVGLSYHYFSSNFKQAVGQSFKEFLNSVRLKEAEKLLLSTEKSMTEIAVEVGFATSSHFIANFKQKKGITPKQFKLRLSGNE